MKQIQGSKNCLAIVGCMATQTSIEDFEKECGTCPSDGYQQIDLYRYLLKCGFIVGMGMITEHLHLTDFDKITAEVVIHGFPAYLSVKSENISGAGHAIYWDGKKICDPNPLVADGRPLSAYKIEHWFPINKIQ